jgi:hypothetical protein
MKFRIRQSLILCGPESRKFVLRALSTPWNFALSKSPKWHFGTTRRQKWDLGPFDNLKHCFHELGKEEKAQN